MQARNRIITGVAVAALIAIPTMGAKGCSTGSSGGSQQGTFQEYGTPNGHWWFGHNPPAKKGGQWQRRGNARFGPAKGQPIWIFIPD